ncbi:hypothetical protein HGG72_09805 [Ochrobactrum pecoris]|uniref:Uncharacterized protein n=1 Tax=Brucella pecoris TaxID=867683 RepID=A0A5C5CU33_9HYPH|nr:hypothetical protein [Brucella pecoris]MBB4092726.1 hypothetical protein [Brucella pecoris]NKW80577.1 hypothetical protein [Brucella pecoris]TNV14541.1 hypothetical protein FIB18_04765 [Brucella pecoris]
MDEIGHVGNSSVFTYVYFLFYFCSKVNTCSGAAFILGFTNSEYTTAGMSPGKPTAGGRVRTPSFETPPAAAPQDEVRGAPVIMSRVHTEKLKGRSEKVVKRAVVLSRIDQPLVHVNTNGWSARFDQIKTEPTLPFETPPAAAPQDEVCCNENRC